MSLSGRFRLLSARDLARLKSDPERALDLLAPDDEPVPADELLDLDETWHVLHYLLTGTADEAPLPLGLILGGEPIGDDLGAGPARLLSPAEVASAARALSRISLEQLRQRFVPDELGINEVYAFDLRGQSSDELEQAWTWVSDNFSSLRAFLERAVQKALGCVAVIL